MNLHAGSFLSCTDPEDSVFRGAIVLVVEYNSNGAVGVIINQSYGRTLNALQEFRDSKPFPLHRGGPVDTEHLFFLHRRADKISGGTQAFNEVYWGGDFSDAVQGINDGSLSAKDLKIFVGYCGWDAGDLERELAAGAWLIIEASVQTIF